MADAGYSQVIAGAQKAIGDTFKSNNVADALGGFQAAGGKDALQAYQITQAAQAARQKLESDKQQQEMNKANWALKGLEQSLSLTGKAQKLYNEQFGKSLEKLYPGSDVKTFLTQATNTPEDGRNAITAVKAMLDASQKQGGKLNPDQIDHVTGMFGLQGALGLVTKGEEMRAQIEAAQLKNAGMAGRVGAMQDTGVQTTGDKWSKHPGLQSLRGLGQTLKRDQDMLDSNDPKHPVTYETLNEALQTNAAVLGQGSGLSDARVKAITPSVSSAIENEIKGFLGDDPDQPASKKYIDYVLNQNKRLLNAVKANVGEVNSSLYAGYSQPGMFNNPNIPNMAKQKYQFYADPNKWLNPAATDDGNGTATQSTTPSAAGTPSPASGTTAGGAPETKVWNGVTYAKVGAQWVPQGPALTAQGGATPPPAGTDNSAAPTAGGQ